MNKIKKISAVIFAALLLSTVAFAAAMIYNHEGYFFDDFNSGNSVNLNNNAVCQGGQIKFASSVTSSSESISGPNFESYKDAARTENVVIDDQGLSLSSEQYLSSTRPSPATAAGPIMGHAVSNNNFICTGGINIGGNNYAITQGSGFLLNGGINLSGLKSFDPSQQFLFNYGLGNRDGAWGTVLRSCPPTLVGYGPTSPSSLEPVFGAAGGDGCSFNCWDPNPSIHHHVYHNFAFGGYIKTADGNYDFKSTYADWLNHNGYAYLYQEKPYDTGSSLKVYGHTVVLDPDSPSTNTTSGGTAYLYYYVFGGYGFDHAGGSTPKYLNEVNKVKVTAGPNNDLATVKVEPQNASDGPSARYFHSAVWEPTTAGGRILVFGGCDGTNYLNDLWEYNPNPAAKTWTEILIDPANRPKPRFAHKAVWKDGKMYIFGGYNATDGYLNDFWVYDPSKTNQNQRWTRIGLDSNPTARAFHSFNYSPYIGTPYNNPAYFYILGGYKGSISHPIDPAAIITDIGQDNSRLLGDDITLTPKTGTLDGTYVSTVFDKHENVSINSLKWSQTSPPGTSVTILISAGDSPNSLIYTMLTSEASSGFFEVNPGLINHEYFKISVTLHAASASPVPIVSSIEIGYCPSQAVVTSKDPITPIWDTTSTGEKSWSKAKFSGYLYAGDKIEVSVGTLDATSGDFIPTTPACSTIISGSTGNVAGIVDIHGLSTTTYPSLYLKAVLTRGSPSNSPYLDDWSASWVQANAGGNRNATAYSPVIFNGDKSIGDALLIPPGGEDLEYQWSFGDGQLSAWSTNESTTHPYNLPGLKYARLSIKRPGMASNDYLSKDEFTVNVIANFIFTNNGNIPVTVAKGEYGTVATFETNAIGTENWQGIWVPVGNHIDWIDSMEIFRGTTSIGTESTREAGRIKIDVGSRSFNSTNTYQLKINIKDGIVVNDLDNIINLGPIGQGDIVSDLPTAYIANNTTPQISPIRVVRNNPLITIEASSIADANTVLMDSAPTIIPLIKFWGKTHGPAAAMNSIAINPYDMGDNLNDGNVTGVEIVKLSRNINDCAAFKAAYIANPSCVIAQTNSAFDKDHSASVDFNGIKPSFDGTDPTSAYFVVLRVSPTDATPGEKIGVSLNPSSGNWSDTFDFGGDGTIITPSPEATLPQKSAIISVNNINILAHPSDIASSEVYQGTTDLPVIQFDIKNPVGGPTWKIPVLESIKITKSDTPTHGLTSADRVDLYCIEDGAEINVGGGAFMGTNSVLIKPISPSVIINSAPKTFIVKANINSVYEGQVSFRIDSAFTYIDSGTTVHTTFDTANPFSTKQITILKANNIVNIEEIRDTGLNNIVQRDEGVVMGITLKKTDSTPGAATFNTLTIWPRSDLGVSSYDLKDVEFKVYKVASREVYERDQIDESRCEVISDAYKFSSTDNSMTIYFKEDQPINGTQYYFLSAKADDLAKFNSPDESIASLICLSLNDIESIGISEGDTLTVSPSLSFPKNLPSINILDKGDTLFVVPTKISTLETEARQGGTFAICKLNSFTDEDYALLRSITIQKQMDLPDNLITFAAIYHDENNNGVFDSNDVIASEQALFSNGTATIQFDPYKKITPDQSNDAYFVVLGISNSSDAVGKSINVAIQNQSSITLLGGVDTPSLEASPFISETFKVVDRYVPSVPIIRNLDYNNYSSNFRSIKFSWDSTAEMGISKLKYYFTNTPIDPAKIINWEMVQNPSSMIIFDCAQPLEQGKTYYLYAQTVSSVNGVEYKSLFAKEHMITADVTPPLKLSHPQIYTDAGVSSKIQSNSIITSGFYTIEWNPSMDIESSILNYEVQERDNENAAWRTILLENPKDINKNNYHETYTLNIIKTDPFKTYYYRVRAQNGAGLWSEWSEESVNVVVGQVSSVIAGEPTNYPNPFDSRNGSTNINFSVGAIGNYDGDIKIFDMYGRLVKKIDFDGVGPITKEIEWNGENGAGAKVSKGIYLAVITVNADSGKSEKKIRKVGVIH